MLELVLRVLESQSLSRVSSGSVVKMGWTVLGRPDPRRDGLRTRNHGGWTGRAGGWERRKQTSIPATDSLPVPVQTDLGIGARPRACSIVTGMGSREDRLSPHVSTQCRMTSNGTQDCNLIRPLAGWRSRYSRRTPQLPRSGV